VRTVARSSACSAVVLSLAVGLFVACRPTPRDVAVEPVPPASPMPTSKDLSPASVTPAPIRFSTVSPADSGIDFTYYGSPGEQHYMTEQNGGGVALFDADADGRLDVFLVNGSDFQRPATSAAESHQLYRQTADWRFLNVTAASRLQSWDFGQGCAAGDYDNDGFVDLFVANYGPSRLWHNAGDGTFTEVTSACGIHANRWATSAAFADLDCDGNLDLYVVNYVDWTPEHKSAKRIPSPMDFAGLPDLLFQNNGSGTFREIGAAAGIAIPEIGKGLAVGMTDLTRDGLPDIYIANDTTRNFLFRNLGHLKFEETGIRSGCATSQDGGIGSSMGVAIADYNRDGWQDIAVTNFAGELLDIFTGIGPGEFLAGNTELGVDIWARRPLKFGVLLADFDADSWPDLFFANGHLWEDSAAGGEYQMLPGLLHNMGGTRFINAAPSAGEYFQRRWLGRAAAGGDLDNDGDYDLLVSHLLDPAALLRNDSERSGNVLRLELIGVTSTRQPLGTRVEVVVNGRTLVEHVPSGESFQSALDHRLLISLGAANRADEVRVDWSPDRREVWQDVPVGKLIQLVEGTGGRL